MTKQTFDQLPNELWVTAVQVATVWTEPESARKIDEPGLSNPTDMDKWVDTLAYEKKVALCDENRVQTQLLYGEPVLITETKDNWAHVVIPSQPSHKDGQGYPGWVPLNQLKKVDKKDWEQDYFAAVTDDKAWLESESGEKILKVSYMTVLPVETETGEMVKVVTPHGPLYVSTTAVTVYPAEHGLPKRDGTQVVKDGKRYLGLDYFWGGMSSFGYDCSGFAYNMHKANGYQIPRDAGDQADAGEKVEYDELQPGDLLFFAYNEGKGKLHHVGFYYGDGRMLHSPMTGKGIEIVELKGTKYEKELCAATRYWQKAEENE